MSPSRMPMLMRAAAGAVLGAIVASAALAILTLQDPSLILDFRTDLPRSVTSGFYPVERNGDESFVWTAPMATLVFRGLDRDTAWRCTMRLRGARPAGSPVPEIAIAVDGVARLTKTAEGAYES